MPQHAGFWGLQQAESIDSVDPFQNTQRTYRPRRCRRRLAALLAGVLALGLSASGAWANPTNPASGTLSPSTPKQTFTGGPDYLSDPTPAPVAGGGPTCNTTLCDDYTLNLAIPASYASQNPTALVNIFLGWSSATGQGDYDLYVYDQNGNLLGSDGASAATPEDVKLSVATLLKNGVSSLDVRIVPFVADGSAYTGTITLEVPPPPPASNGTIYTADSSPPGVPRYQLYAAPSQFDNFQNEESIGVDWLTGATLFSALSGTQCRPANTGVLDCGMTLKTTYDFSTSPAQTTWSNVTADNQFATFDPILFTFDALGHTLSDQLISALGYPPGCSLMAQTDDDGASWIPDEGCGLPTSGSDHQTVGGGPYSSAVPLPAPNPVFPQAVYFCSQEFETAYCARSDDGGLTFSPGVPIYNAVANTPVNGGPCQGLHGHVKVSPADGTVYVPNGNCQGSPGLAVSTDDGNTWTVRTVPNATTIDSTIGSGSDPSLWVAADGTVYFAWQGPDANGNDAHLYVAESHDQGQTWVNVQDLSGSFGIVNTVFPAVVAGDPNRAAVAFLGARVSGNYQAANYAGRFRLYIATTYDGGKTWTMVDATPLVPVQAPGGICTGGSGCSGTNRNLLDFIDANLDSHGRVVVAYAEGCTGVCVTSGGASNTFDALPSIAYQSGGRPLFAKYDPTEPSAPQPPLLVSATAQTSGAVTLNWDAPDDGGSPITGYVVNRGTASGQETQLTTTASPKTSYVDSSAQPGVTYFYTVAAVNAVGTSAVGNEVKSGAGTASGPTSPCTLPGVTVVTDPAGDQTGAPQNSEYDLTGIDIAEPYKTGAVPNLVITLAVSNLSGSPTGGLPPNAYWKVYFTFKGTTYFVDMDTAGTDPTTPEFVYGTESGSLDTVTGPLPAGSGYSTATNTITFVVPTSLVGNPAAGDTLSAINGKTQELGGAAGTGLLLAFDTTGNGTYTLIGNAACAPNTPPIASLTATPTKGPAPLAVTFDASGSSDPDGDTLSYSFNFGDGSSPVSQTTPTVNHTYQTAGNYAAGVTVTDSHGLTATRGVTITVQAGGGGGGGTAPTASLTASPASGAPPLQVSFDASGSTAPSGASLQRYRFDFGDGSSPVSQTTPTVKHTYQKVGSYAASVTVTDSNGHTASAATTVTVQGAGAPSAPEASLAVSPSSGEIPLTVSFDASGSHNPDGAQIVAYTFDFNDGSAVVTQNTPTISHTYQAAGTYHPSVIVKDSQGETSGPAIVTVQATTTVVVTPGGPVAELTVNPNEGPAPLTVTFDGSRSYDPNASITSYTFDFGDGSQPLTQSKPTATHTYNVPGRYVPSLTVADTQGKTSRAEATVNALPVGGSSPPSAPAGHGGGAIDLLTLLGLLGLGLSRRGRT